VTLTKGPGSTNNFSILGGNRGDYDVSFGSANDAANGVITQRRVTRSDCSMQAVRATM
jgi:hypothetical protein